MPKSGRDMPGYRDRQNLRKRGMGRVQRSFREAFGGLVVCEGCPEVSLDRDGDA